MSTEEVIQTEPQRGTENKMLRVLAKFVSYLLHPIFMPLILLGTLYYVSPISFVKYKGTDLQMVFARVALITVFFPLLVVLLLKGLGFIKSIFMRTQKERIIPLLWTMICYWWVSHVFKNTDAPLIMQVLFKGSYWGLIVLFVCSIFFKISMHTMAAGGMLGFLTVLIIMSPVDMTIPLIAAIVVAGFSGTARLLLGAHTQFEIWSGYVLGILVQLAAYWYLL
ncbi:MAG: hypothetical protein H6551_01420 [Chitinophagales bacterium]|nr:hypothetical protein [Chitinophagales bacterium]